MKLNLFSLRLALLLFAAASIPAVVKAGELTKVYYPNQEEAAFTVDIPSGWKMIPQGEQGAEEFFEVEGPNGVELSFRIVPVKDPEKAVEEHIEYLKANFTDVKMEELKETKINGMEAFLLPAKAKDEDGSQRDIGAGWFLISEGVIGELWYNVEVGDEEGTKAAVAALNSLAPGKAAAKSE